MITMFTLTLRSAHRIQAISTSVIVGARTNIGSVNSIGHFGHSKDKSMDGIRNGWFSEIQSDLWPGQCMSLQVDTVLHQEKSAYQDVLVLQTKKHGRALILDNIIQCTEFDEFAYQEMIAFLPLCAHPAPKEVLIIGGGDGGVAREVTKHPLVQQVTQVEIDDKVIAASKKHLPFMSSGFDSGKLQLIVGDGFAYMDQEQQRGRFDVIITDSSDPVGPAANLFTENYFRLLAGALKPGGIICSQAGCIWTGLKAAKDTATAAGKHFQRVRYALLAVPTYPCGQIALLLATNDSYNLHEPKNFLPEFQANDKLRYYDADVHRAAFTLPKFANTINNSSRA